jgi:hypothetical protein
METLTIAGALGILVPLVVGVLTKISTSSTVKSVLAVSLCVLVGVVVAGTAGQLPGAFWGDVETYVKYIGVAAVAAQTAYEMFIRPTKISTFLQDNVGITD